MYIRRAFTVFLDVLSQGEPRTAPVPDWTLDWRWFEEATAIVSPPALPLTHRRIIIREE